jgi:hypothetical protein
MTEIKLKTSASAAIERVLLTGGTLLPNYMGWCGKDCKRCVNFDCNDIRDLLPDLGFEGALCDEIVRSRIAGEISNLAATDLPSDFKKFCVQLIALSDLRDILSAEEAALGVFES